MVMKSHSNFLLEAFVSQEFVRSYRKMLQTAYKRLSPWYSRQVSQLFFFELNTRIDQSDMDFELLNNHAK